MDFAIPFADVPGLAALSLSDECHLHSAIAAWERSAIEKISCD